MNSVGIVSFRDVGFFQMNVGFRDFSPIHDRCSRDEIFLLWKHWIWTIFLCFAGMRNKPERTVADDSRKLMFRTNLQCAKPFFLRNPRQHLQVWPRIHCDDNSSFFCLIDVFVFPRKVIQEFSVMLLLSWRLFSFWWRYDWTTSSFLVAEFLLLTQLTTVWCVFLKRLSSFDERLLALSFYLALSLRRALSEILFT